MKRIAIAGGLSILVLLGGSAWGAPRRGKAKPRSKPAVAKLAPITEFTVAENSSTDIRGFGVSTSWTLKSNGTVVKSGNHEGANMGDSGQQFRENGTFYAGDFKLLVAHLASSKLLDLKPAKAEMMEGTTEFSIVRGGKRRTLYIPDSTPYAKVWTTMKIVRGILADVEWKNDAGYPVNTGVNVNFTYPTDEQAPDYPVHNMPTFSIRDEKGKEIVEAYGGGPNFGIHEPLPPGNYQIVPKRPAVHAPNAQGYAFRASQDKFRVNEGSYTYLTVEMQKVTTAP